MRSATSYEGATAPRIRTRRARARFARPRPERARGGRAGRLRSRAWEPPFYVGLLDAQHRIRRYRLAALWNGEPVGTCTPL